MHEELSDFIGMKQTVTPMLQTHVIDGPEKVLQTLQ